MINLPVLKVVIDSPHVFANIESVRIADRDGGVGDFSCGHGESRDGHPLRIIIPVGQRAGDLQMWIHL